MLFITLLEPKGKGDEAVRYIKNLRPPKGIEVHGAYFTLGKYDGVIVFEAPDVKTAMGFAMQVGFATQYKVETLTGIDAKEI